MSLVRKTLQNNLSLSSKLFLKEIFFTFKTAATAIGSGAEMFWDKLVGAASRVGIDIPTRRYSLKPPALQECDFTFTPDVLSIPVPIDRLIKTSIVIPVFNQAAFTYRCLKSLLQELNLRESEIIVVNNGSTDETGQVLVQVAHLLCVINNSENRGFVDACNQGAAIARGKYLVFLNNDTTVLRGWLSCLLETIDGSASVGAVGSMFLYPDGSIQEAGAIVWQNGEPDRYGWGGSPHDRRLNFAREVDYCSAASLLVRKDLFDRVGGFDRRFAPAFYEDVDLCFAIRSAGYQVIYQPSSRLIHYEGVTAGRDTTKGIKHLQILNREKFVDKWRAVLEQQHLKKDSASVEDAANRRRDRPRIIVFDVRVPTPDRDAGSGRMLMILKSLSVWSNVVFVPFSRSDRDDYEAVLWKNGIETADAADYRRVLKTKNVVAAIVSRPSIAELFIPRIRRLNNRIPIVFDTVDAHFVRLEREYKVTQRPELVKDAMRYRRIETKLVRDSDVVWCASSEDKRVMEQAVPGKAIEVVPTIHEVHGSTKPFEERNGLLFVGNLAHRPNEDAVHFFMREIYPLLESSLPHLTVCIVGDNVPRDISSYESNEVKIKGYVPDIEPFFEDSRVFVAPLRFGAGIKGKIGEAMGHGLPVVTTSIGAEGFCVESGKDLLIADDPIPFAEAVRQLYSDKTLWQRLAENGRQQIQRYFTPAVVAETIKNSILTATTGEHPPRNQAAQPQ